jgi:Fe-S-cluster containining protein
MSKIRKRLVILKNQYKKIPNANCKGLCQSGCTMIGFTKLEGQQMSEAAGRSPFLTDDADCGYLSEGKCSVYDQRPAICRLYGATEKMPCPHGCKPDRMLAETESEEILAKIDSLSDGKMYSNISALQAYNMKMGKPLSELLSIPQ